MSGSLKIYRAGNIGRDKIRNGISFYGISKYGIKSYTSKSNPKFYDLELTSDEVIKIVDLSIPENSEIVVDYLKTLSNKGQNKNNHNLLRYSLFFGKNNINNVKKNNIVIRHSNDVDDDIKMAKILRTLFKDAIGTYTPPGPGLSHGEIIIWDEEINKRLMGVTH